VIKDEYPYQTSYKELQFKYLSRYFEYYHDYPRGFHDIYLAQLSRISNSLKKVLTIFFTRLLIGLWLLIRLVGLAIYWFIFG